MKFKTRIYTLLLISTFGTQLTCATELPRNIKIFTASPNAFENKERVSFGSIVVEVLDLSLTRNIEKNLGRNLSDNPTIAIGQATSRIQSNINELKKSFQKAIRAQILADEFGISRLPAAVIDNAIIVYGTTDLDQILKEWINSKSERQY